MFSGTMYEVFFAYLACTHFFECYKIIEPFCKARAKIDETNPQRVVIPAMDEID